MENISKRQTFLNDVSPTPGQRINRFLEIKNQIKKRFVRRENETEEQRNARIIKAMRQSGLNKRLGVTPDQYPPNVGVKERAIDV
ncbi:hypothetical protein KA005_12120 [bacterium]|nr:hypothetical protein [bacterium]